MDWRKIDDLQQNLRGFAQRGDEAMYQCLMDAADEIDRLRSLTTWQPIETAPKDGTWVLGWWPSCDTVAQMRWGRESRLTVEHWHYLGGWTPAHEPTYWLPLPPPPEADT